jgi:hypothetical protein
MMITSKTVTVAVLSVLATVWYIHRPVADKRVATLMIIGTAWILFTSTSDFHEKSTDQKSTDQKSTDQKSTDQKSTDQNYVTDRVINNASSSSLHLRGHLYTCLNHLPSRIPRLRNACPRRLADAVKSLEVFFQKADKALMQKKKLMFLDRHIQTLRDLRADALNALHSLHFATTTEKQRKHLYKCVQVARLESLRTLSAIVVKHNHNSSSSVSSITPMSLHLGGPSAHDPTRETHTAVFL